MICDLFGSSGYSAHGRQLSNALYELGYDVRVECNKPVNWQAQVNDAELNMLLKDFDPNCVTIMIGQPQFWRLALSQGAKHFIGFVVWEGEKVPASWVKYILDERVTQVWMPSVHVDCAIQEMMYREEDINHYLSKKHIVPHGVNMAVFQPPLKHKKKQPFTFVCNKGWAQGINDRGGVQWLLKAYFEEFTSKDNVRLKIKINPSYCPPGWDFKNEVKKLGINKKKDSPELMVCNNLVPFKELLQFYDGDVFVCPTMGEAFNLTGLEAKACGLMTLQTGFGGQMDYMSEICDMVIPYELVDVTWDMDHEGNRWGKVRLGELKKQMRWLYNHKKEVKKRNAIAREQASHFTWLKSAKKAKKALDQL